MNTYILVYTVHVVWNVHFHSSNLGHSRRVLGIFLYGIIFFYNLSSKYLVTKCCLHLKNKRIIKNKDKQVPQRRSSKPCVVVAEHSFYKDKNEQQQTVYTVFTTAVQLPYSVLILKIKLLAKLYLFLESLPPSLHWSLTGSPSSRGREGELILYPGAILHIDCLFDRYYIQAMSRYQGKAVSWIG